MKILHIADLHLGQVIYQNYDRTDEHHDFFCQLKELCRDCDNGCLNNKRRISFMHNQQPWCS